MFYETAKNDHGLPHNPFKACVVPRPIGWISSINAAGQINLAPYSFFNAVCEEPPMVMFSSINKRADNTDKDSISNIEETGEFVVNIATYALHNEVNQSSAALPKGESEFNFTGLETEPSVLVKPPRVKKSPIHLECLYHQSVQLPGANKNFINRIVIGKVIGIHIDESVITNGIVDIKKIQPIARLGYMEYALIDNIFTMKRPL